LPTGRRHFEQDGHHRHRRLLGTEDHRPQARGDRPLTADTGSKWGPANPLGHSLVRDGSPDIDCGNWGKKQPVFHILLCIDTNIAGNARRSRHRSSKNRLRDIFE